MVAKKKMSINQKVRKNPWVYTTLVFGVLILVLASVILFSGSVSKNKAGNVILDLAQQQLGDEVSLKSVEKFGENFYVVTLTYQGQDSDVFVTKDGLDLAAGVTPLSTLTEATEAPTPTQQPTQEIAKSDKPVVELFIMSHCPYGTQIEKGILPVAKELGNKIDFEMKFVNYAMHPTQGEVEEQLNQYCIQRDYNDKYLDYLGKFLENGNSKEAFSSVGLSESDISKCVEETDKEFDVIKNLEDKASWSSGRFPKFMIHDAENKEYGVQGSPTLIINGQKAQSGRDAQSLLNVICSAFTIAPEECGTDMTSYGNPAPGFGFDTQGSASAAGCGF